MGSHGNRCAIATCNSTSERAKKAGVHVTFFTFPKDPNTRDEWVHKCQRESKINPNTARICCLHFQKNDYEDAIKARIMGFHPKKLLKNAVPTLRLPPTKLPEAPAVHQESVPTPNSATSTKEANKNVASSPEAVVEIEPDLVTYFSSYTSPEEVVIEPAVVTVSSSHQIPAKAETCLTPAQPASASVTEDSPQNQVAKLQAELLAQQKKNDTLQKSVRLREHNILVLASQVQNLEERLVKQERSKDKMLLAVKGCLTPNQLDALLENKIKKRWSEEDLSRAFTLRHLSKKTYLYLKYELNYPLPGLSTVRRWSSKNGKKFTPPQVNIPGFYRRVMKTQKERAQKQPSSLPERTKSPVKFFHERVETASC